MAENQIDGLASRHKEFLSRKVLEKDLEEVSGDKKTEKLIKFMPDPLGFPPLPCFELCLPAGASA
jgi:hypothetical protein